MSALDRLAQELREEGGLLAEALVEPAQARLDLDALATRTGAGARAAAAPGEYGLVLAAVREGYLLHYGDGLGTIVQPTERDLGLLGGDRLYALGLARLAALGDLDAVSELADLISLCAQAHAGAAGDDAGARALADAAWQAAARAIGDGATPALARAKERARAGEVDAANALRDAAEVPDLP
ncbi:hypothetical protein [Conexibacter sp. CPCC 206217]|uniref:hypothetical protein n=1 Tax=Conexibacter sp. CPCC 206217 TaxID=3064574 RepID=UPI00271F472D|nr:hypothetical protein [Conexibacter sp. CPCC 206217]MDO8211478.1 hypothetical protein [Conexibacter sp. CPCC 206217]